ncbi:MAG: MFS transporter [Acholeplasmataceae bacterium]|nr:MFS transporter [Acholeplasmataceae bacterium]
MKLDYKKTFYVGLAFFIITIFWQTYDSIITKILIDKFGLNQTWSGVVMALDNVLALFMLPLFGAISDRTNHKLGRRTPYVIIGTVVAAFAFIGLSFVDNIQTNRIEETTIISRYELIVDSDDSVKELEIFWKGLTLEMRLERTVALANGEITQARFDSWESGVYDQMNKILTNNTAPTLSAIDQSYLDGYYHSYLSDLAWMVTVANPLNFIVFVGILLIALIAMSVFRSPAVSLMPDVTMKPLRSKANAIINLMGAAAGVTALVLLTVFGLGGRSYVNYTMAFVSVGVIMLIVLAFFLWKVKEPKLVAERVALDLKHGLSESEEDVHDMKDLPRDKKISLYLILISVFLWFMGYNAVMTKVSDYAPKILQLPSFALPLLVANVTAIIAFIPIGILSTKFGRRKTILAGIILLTLCFGSVFFLTKDTGWVMFIIFGLTGIGWATINVNSYPMVVELAKGSNVGKYTGYYYSFSMAAQILTPILSGFLMDSIHQKALFPYATFFVATAFITMYFTKHGDSKAEKKSILESFDVDMD